MDTTFLYYDPVVAIGGMFGGDGYGVRQDRREAPEET